MNTSKKISRSQLEIIADFMEENPKLFQGSVDKDFTKPMKDTLWRELCDVLNSAGGNSPKKSLEKWRKCFKDYKCYVKKKYQVYLQDTTKPLHFDSLDGRYLKMMGFENLQGIHEHDYKSSNFHSYMLEEMIDTSEYKEEEENHKFYHAPNIITLLQTPRTNSNAISSPTSPEKMQPLSPSVERTNTKNLDSSSSHSNSTAEALHAIAKEMGVKNRLAKRKIELMEESLLLEKRKIEAFELIAKRLK